MNTTDLTAAITATLGDAPTDFDINAIADEITDTYGADLASIDAIPGEEYWAIVERHDTTA
ncbi:hypothetical protein [Streptosporangium jomthongense]|uniref:Uncharacterized protein n=1 Tax=Streptosporangium jomthongense TaxID=1193683 RepID=A0ABV8FCI4_9ACTN